MNTTFHALSQHHQVTGNERSALCGSSPGPLDLRSLELQRAIRLPEVLRLTGLSRSTWYAKLNPRDSAYDPEAPRPFKLGASPGSPSAWWAWEVIAYLQAKSETRQAR
ncbi:helix-turn-helix transcriptional regulator [Luteimonas sp. e5]